MNEEALTKIEENYDSIVEILSCFKEPLGKQAIAKASQVTGVDTDFIKEYFSSSDEIEYVKNRRDFEVSSMTAFLRQFFFDGKKWSKCAQDLIIQKFTSKNKYGIDISNLLQIAFEKIEKELEDKLYNEIITKLVERENNPKKERKKPIPKWMPEFLDSPDPVSVQKKQTS
jgi:hypothetical protein